MQQFDANGSPLKTEKTEKNLVPYAPKFNRRTEPLLDGFSSPISFFLEEKTAICWAPAKESSRFLLPSSPLNMDENTPPKANLNRKNYRKRKASDNEVSAIENGDFGF